MNRHRCRTAPALIAVATCIVGMVIGLPLLAMGSGGIDPNDPCRPDDLTAPVDGATTIEGSSTLIPIELAAWWDTTGRRQPSALGLAVDDVIALYLSEGDAEGVRGDLAFAQAIHETGWFTSTDTAGNNFAGVNHPDGRPAGRAFPDVLTGVRAHIQLLKKYAAGNHTRLAHPDVAPNAGAAATTWEQLAGTWATDPGYWAAIANLYHSMLAAGGEATDPAPAPATQDCLGAQPAGRDTYKGTPGNVPLVRVGGIIVHHDIATQVDRLLAAAAKDGLTLTGSGYRDPERQIELRRAHCGTTAYAIYEAPASSCSPFTARPGTSMHELGLAIDFNNCSTRSTRCWQWLNIHAATYGFFNLPSEPWHWSTDGS